MKTRHEMGKGRKECVVSVTGREHRFFGTSVGWTPLKYLLLVVVVTLSFRCGSQVTHCRFVCIFVKVK